MTNTAPVPTVSLKLRRTETRMVGGGRSRRREVKLADYEILFGASGEQAVLIGYVESYVHTPNIAPRTSRIRMDGAPVVRWRSRRTGPAARSHSHERSRQEAIESVLLDLEWQPRLATAAAKAARVLRVRKAQPTAPTSTDGA